MSQAPALSRPAVEVAALGSLTASIMLPTVMQVLDTTIANVALPHMAASLGASQEEITWVLTSYIVAAVIAIPLTGWLTDRIGRRTVFLGAIAGFTVASLLYGIATSLEEMVLFSVLQGICGAMVVPLAQTVLLDINPRETIGQAGDLWRRHHGGPDHWLDPGRLADGIVQLALCLPDQPAAGSRRARRHHGPPASSPAPRCCHRSCRTC